MPVASAQQMQRVVDAVRGDRAAVPHGAAPVGRGRGTLGFTELKEVAIEDLLGRDPVLLDWTGDPHRARRPHGAGDRRRRFDRLGAVPPVRAAAASTRWSCWSSPSSTCTESSRNCARDFPDTGAAAGARRLRRPGGAAAACAGQGGRRRVPCRRLQARAAAGGPGARGRAQQRARDQTVGTRPARSARRRQVRADLHRQGGQPGQRDGREQARRPRWSARRWRGSPARASSPCASATCSTPPAAWCRCSASRSAAGGPVTVTHPEITRYFMTIPGGLPADPAGRGAAAGLPRSSRWTWASRCAIRDLAEQMIRLAGKQPGQRHRDRVHRPAPRREAARDACSIADERYAAHAHPQDPPGRAARVTLADEHRRRCSAAGAAAGADRRRRRRRPDRAAAPSRCPSTRRRPRRRRHADPQSSRPSNEHAMIPHPQGRVPGRRPRHPLPAGHQDRAEGNAADHRQAADPVRGRRSHRSRLRHAGVRHQPLQALGRGLLRQGLRARTEAGEGRQVRAAGADPRRAAAHMSARCS